MQLASKLLLLVGASSLLFNGFAATITQTYSGAFPASITGSLPDQASVLLERFTLPAIGTLTITTTSYATGGFQPNLLLFNSLGNFVAAGSPFGSADPGTGLIGDMRLIIPSLASGTYTLALTDFLLNQSFTATNLSDGFTSNFGSGSTFSDAGANLRTGNFAFIISTTASAAAAPEPSGLWFVSPIFVAVALLARRRRFTASNS